MTRMKRGLGVFAKVFALLFLAGIAIPRVVNVLAGYIVPAGAVAVSRLGVVVNGVLNVLGVGR
ncbi:MAG: hypothetical protein ACM3X4_09340 [Ignavibacteriales bacterium]